MNKRVIALILVSILTLSLVLTGCVNNQNEPQEVVNGKQENSAAEEEVVGVDNDKPTDEGHGIMMTATTEEGKTLNPHTYDSDEEAVIMEKVNGMLYNLYPNKDGTNYELREELANGEPIKMDDEGKIWNIEINPDAKWENGEPINADTFIYSYKMLLDPKLINIRAGRFATNPIIIENAENYYLQKTDETIGEVAWEDVGLAKIDEHTIELRVSVPTNITEIKYHFCSRATAPVYEPLYEEWMNEDRTETRYGTDETKFISSGAFKLDKWVKSLEIKYLKNPFFTNKDIVWLAGIHTRVVPDAGTQRQMFENGEIDYLDLSAEDYKEYEEDPRVFFSPSILVQTISINSGNPKQPLLGNKNFRKALFFGINREEMAALSKQKPANYILSTRNIFDMETGIKWRDMDESKDFLTPNYGYDPEGALEYFETALKEEGINQVTLQLNYYDTDESIKLLSEYMQKDLANLFGEDKFTLNLQALPIAQVSATMRDYINDPSSYELSWSDWEGGEFRPWGMLHNYTTDFERKNEPFSNEKFDELDKDIYYGEAKTNSSLKAKYLAEMEEILLDEVPIIPIYERVGKTLISDRLILPVEKWTNGIEFGYSYSKIAE